MVGDDIKGIEWVKDRYEFYEGDIVNDFDAKGPGEKGYKFDWNKVGDWYVQFDTIYNWYKNKGGCDGEAKFGRMLTDNGILKAQRKIDGRNYVCRVGIRKPRKSPQHFVDIDDDL